MKKYLIVLVTAIIGSSQTTNAYRDLETGTFLTRDPIGFIDGPNIYCYVHSNPITHFDALGLYFGSVTETEGGKSTTTMSYTASVVVEGNVTDSTREYIASRLEASKESTFTGDEGDHSWSMDADFTVCSSASDAPEENHIIMVVKDVKAAVERDLGKEAASKLTENSAGAAQQGGRVTYIALSTIGTKTATNTKASMERTGGHETGHIAGLNHPEEGDGTPDENLMHQTKDSTSMDLTSAQINQIQSNVDDGSANKGVSEPASEE